ncbi:hypothetical protein F9L33_06210 [Amylibacter sp. SFDW26]|uniref:hypothetical protein n=1 Tax=Amylibacter sp. SFDW26 TaxID=2652722 RepID=UPI0012627CCF|nr:hypothetical protein [Amylibacter sp. SFDW26]KAB7616338.1 hypothetical protein F9L33_06210 [Amylibacter sp. SFDW26]
MAIYIGLKCIEKAEPLLTYRFFKADGTEYGVLVVDTSTAEICLLSAVDERASVFAFPRACRAIQLRLKDGLLPDELCYAA